MARTFIVKDNKHPLYGQRVAGFDERKAKRKMRPTPATSPIEFVDPKLERARTKAWAATTVAARVIEHKRGSRSISRANRIKNPNKRQGIKGVKHTPKTRAPLTASHTREGMSKTELRRGIRAMGGSATRADYRRSL